MTLDLVLITGMSGSGKSVALHALEDAGYYCVDNLPPELLTSFIALQHEQQATRVAIAMDVRSGVSLPTVPQQLEALRRDGGISLRSLFLDATTDALLRRYSETRRRHPLSRQEGRTDVPEQHRVLVQAIELERELLADLREKYETLFLENLHAGAIGAGRIMSAAGTDIQATLINCFVQPVGDCIQGVDDEDF